MLKNATWEIADLRRCLAAWHEAGHAVIALIIMPGRIVHAYLADGAERHAGSKGHVALLSKPGGDISTEAIEKRFAVSMGGMIGASIGLRRGVVSGADKDLLDQYLLAAGYVNSLLRHEDGKEGLFSNEQTAQVLENAMDILSNMAGAHGHRILKGEIALLAMIAQSLYVSGYLDRVELLALRDQYATGNTYD